MKLWAWRLVLISLSVALACLLAVRLETRRRVAGILLIVAAFALLVLMALSRVTAYFVLSEFRSLSSVLHWVLVGEIVALLAWLAFFSREPFRQRAVRLSLVALSGLLVALYDGHRYRESGIRQELTVEAPRGVHLPAAAVSGRGDWPAWRDPSGANHAEADADFEWTSLEQVAWTAPVPGEGHSSPCVWGDQVFLTTAHEDPPSQVALAFERDTGRLLWQQTLHREGLGPKHIKNSYASSTPCCDGEHLFTAFSTASSVHLTALHRASGRIAWQTRLGDYATSHSFAASPVLFEHLVIVPVEGQQRPFVAAVYRDSGQVAWRTRLRLDGPSYSSPVILPTPHGPQLILPTHSAVIGLDPRTGAARWSCPWAQLDAVATAVFDSTRLYVTGNYPSQEVMAIDPSSESQPRVMWHATRGASKVPSPILAGKDLFLVADDGIANCLDAETGKTVWRKRLGGEFSASPLRVGRNLYAANEDGRLLVIRAARQFEQVAVIELREPVMASPVFCGGQLFLRTRHSLICVGKAPPRVSGT